MTSYQRRVAVLLFTNDGSLLVSRQRRCCGQHDGGRQTELLGPTVQACREAVLESCSPSELAAQLTADVLTRAEADQLNLRFATVLEDHEADHQISTKSNEHEHKQEHASSSRSEDVDSGAASCAESETEPDTDADADDANSGSKTTTESKKPSLMTSSDAHHHEQQLRRFCICCCSHRRQGEPSCTWVFYGQLSCAAMDVASALNKPSHAHQLHTLTSTDLANAAYRLSLDPVVSRLLREFQPIYSGLERITKTVVPPFSSSMEEMQDYHVLQPCFYVFDTPGKGVRSKSVKALSEVFAIDQGDLRSLMFCVDRFHELSLMVDDIEDASSMRRDRECAHLRFGLPATLNSSYFMLFKLMNDIPRLFRSRHQETISLMIEGSILAHRGQGLEIYWRDNHCCPTMAEYLSMVQGKTSTPFVMSAKLFFLHSTDLRLRCSRLASTVLRTACSWLRLPSPNMATPIDQQILDLFDLVGIFFQIRDDYINLTDPAYWQKKGFCDDIYERKFSYPVILVVHGKLGQYEQLLQLYKKEEPLTRTDVVEGLNIIRETTALQETYEKLNGMRDDLYAGAKRLGLKGVLSILDRLSYPPPLKGSLGKEWLLTQG